MSGPICEWVVSASCVRYNMFLSLSAWVDPSVSGLYLPRVCVICSCCHSWHEWTHLWVGCICFECVICCCCHSWHEWTHLWVGYIWLVSVLHVLVVTLGTSGPICELTVSASCVRYNMFLLSLSAWVDPSVSGLYLPRVCVIICSCHSRHEWTHLWVGCICLECALYVLVVTLGMSGPICEWAVSASSVLYVVVVTLGMSGPICEWAISGSCLCYMF